MISCKQCQTPNSLDSTFCKRCGAAIAQTDLVEAQGRLEKLVEEGNALFNQGRTDEALAIAESVVLSNPSSVSGWSLKTLCHERRGEIAEALECADRLVELNPESDFDKIRRSTLRQKLQTDLQPPAAPDRRLAFVGAASAVVLVLCMGAIVAKVNANNAATAQHNALLASNTQTPPNTQPVTQPNNPYVGNPGGQGTVTPPNVGSTGTQNPGPVQAPTNRVDSGQGSGGTRVPNYTGEQLPVPGQDGGGVIGLEPLVPNDLSRPTSSGGQGSGPKLPTNSAPDISRAGDPPPTTIGSNTGSGNTAPAKPEDPGTIEITVHHGGAPRVGSGGAESIEPTGLNSLMRVGGQQFLMGNFAGAARSYEQAIQAGGDPVSVNQRLGQSYQNLGRTSEAAEAFRRCITAIDSALASGKGDKDRLSSVRGVCEQSLKVLGG